MSEQREPMTREKSFDWKLDGLGLAAFGAGAFLSVLAVLALMRAAPVRDPFAAGGTTTLAALWTSTLGAVPCLLFAALLTVLGARTFLLGDSRGALKGVAVGAGIAFGLAILLGSLRLAAAWADGGIAGEALGGTLARRAHPAAGVLLGLVVLAAVAWFATLRERVLAREAREAAGVPEREIPVGVIRPKAPTTATAAAESVEGVTAEEAAALVPDEGHRREALAAALALARRRRDDEEEAEIEEPPPFPYPEDVRLKGLIPEGTRPLGEPPRSHAAPQAAQQGGVVRWTPERRDDADVFAEHARATAIAEPERDEEPAAVRAWARPARTADADETLADDDEESADEALDPEDEAEAAELELDEDEVELDEDDGPELAHGGPYTEEPEQEVVVQAAPPRPSWEQNNLFDDDEPVDAYGTPVSLIETLEQGAAQEPAELDDEDEEPAEVAELEEGDEEDEEYEEEDETAELEEEEDEESAEEEDEELEEAAELEEGGEDDEEHEEDGEDLEEAAELEEGEEEEDHAEEEEDEDLDEAAELDGAVLVPQPTPASEHAKRAGIVDPSKQRLYEAGCLFLDRGRVAVSMLQREYALEFDDACTMLDELQELGLIGPYLGGKHRDILLTSDEWLERVSAS